MKRNGEKAVVETVFFLSALFSALLTIAIFGFMLALGLPLFVQGRFFTIITDFWAPHFGHFGIFPMIIGTLAISFLSMIFALPLCLGCAILISVISSGKIGWLLRKIVEITTGIPTVIYGFVGIFLLVSLVRDFSNAGSGMCVLSASLMLCLMISPTMILFFCDSFDRVPSSYGSAVLAVGGTEIQKFLYVTLPHAWPGIVIGTTLSLGRALGDTIIALMIAGNAVQVPASLLDSTRTLTTHIALVFAADYESLEFKAIFACGIFLYLLTTLLTLTVRLLTAKGERWAR